MRDIRNITDAVEKLRQEIAKEAQEMHADEQRLHATEAEIHSLETELKAKEAEVHQKEGEEQKLIQEIGVAKSHHAVKVRDLEKIKAEHVMKTREHMRHEQELTKFADDLAQAQHDMTTAKNHVASH
jgi:chromosome segregation ATPase